MRHVRVAAVLATTLAMTSLSAQALTVNLLDDSGNTVMLFEEDGVTPLSGPAELDFDVDYVNNDAVWLEVILDDADFQSILPTGQIAYSGIMTNVTGIPWTDFHIELEGIELFPTGVGIVPTFDPSNANVMDPGTTVEISDDGSMAWLFFDPTVLDGQGIEIGIADTLIQPDQDWLINLNGLQPGDTFRIHLQPSIDETPSVPEPVTAALGVVGLSALGFATRRRIG